MNDPDAALMLEFAHGDEEAFVKLYRSYRDRMVGYCMRLLGDLAQAEEAAQDVFLKLYGARASYQPQSRFSTYLYRIATHHCWNLRARLDRTLVKRGVAVEEHADAARGTSDPTERIANEELRAALQSALHTLPENQRAALLLVHHEGFSYREAAEVVEVSESAIKSLVHRARESLTQQLAGFAHGGAEVKHAV